MVELTEREYRQISRLVLDHTGILLANEKQALIVSRLNKLLRRLRMDSFSEYLAHVRADESGRALSELVDRISTNFSYFYRESEHFEFFGRTALRELVERAELRSREGGSRDGKRLKIWVAGCATGEEAYLLAMLLNEHFGSRIAEWDARVLATDISHGALAVAAEGRFPANKLSRLPATYRKRYFKTTSSGDWSVAGELRSLVLFRRLNLVREDYPFQGRFDAIFCRNVMIYFDRPVRSALIRRFHECTHPGAYLFIGQSESLGRATSFLRVRPSVYKREDD